MKILHVIHTMQPEAGGVVEAVRLLAEAMVRLGHKGEVLSLDAPESMAGKLPFQLHEIGPAKGGYGYCSKLVPWLKKHRDDYD
ncbi:MAG: transferase, partial [Verrucomicrobiota bacterium]